MASINHELFVAITKYCNSESLKVLAILSKECHDIVQRMLVHDTPPIDEDYDKYYHKIHVSHHVNVIFEDIFKYKLDKIYSLSLWCSGGLISLIKYSRGSEKSYTFNSLMNNSKTKLSHLRVLNLENVDVKFYDIKNVWTLIHLTSLNLHKNNLSVIPDDILLLTKLRVLDIGDNNLVSVPKDMDKLKELQNLDISGNSILTFSDVKLPKQIRKLSVSCHDDSTDKILLELLESLPNLRCWGPDEFDKISNKTVIKTFIETHPQIKTFFRFRAL